MMVEQGNLLIVTNGKNANGFPVETTQSIPIFVKEKSATRIEYYEAMRSGIYINHVFEVRIEDWELSAHTVDGKTVHASQIQFDGETYDIVRTYRNDKATIELICGTGGQPYVR